MRKRISKKAYAAMAVLALTVLSAGGFGMTACGKSTEEKRAAWEEQQQRIEENAESIADEEAAALDMELIEYSWDKEGKKGFLRFMLYYEDGGEMAEEGSRIEGNSGQISQIQSRADDILMNSFHCDIQGYVSSMELGGSTGELWYDINENGSCPDSVRAGFGENEREYPLLAAKKLTLASFDLSGIKYLKEMYLSPISIELVFDEAAGKIKDEILVEANMKNGEKYICAVYRNGKGGTGEKAEEKTDGAESVIGSSSWIEGVNLKNIFKQHLSVKQIDHIEINGITIPMTIIEPSDNETLLSRQELEEMGREGAMIFLDIYHLSRKFRVDPDELLDNIIRQWGEDRFSPFDSVKE